MADEATIRSQLLILKADDGGRILLQYDSRPSAFTATVTGTKGPTPGAITVPTAGVDVDLSGLTIPGLCRFMNNDDVNFVTYGIWDPAGVRFYPLGEILPHETFVLRLSRDIRDETGTGDPGTAVLDTDNKLRFKASVAAVVCMVEVFEA